MQESPKVSIIMPAYNEEKRIGRALEAYSNYFENLRKQKKISYELSIIINKSTDRTKEIVIEYCKKNKNINYVDLPRKGKGYAIIEGFKTSLEKDFDYIGFVDADLATPAEEYWKLIQNIGNAHGIIANRYLSGSNLFPKPTTQRIIARKMFNFVIRSIIFLPFSDTQCGAKLFKSDSLRKVLPKLSMSQWAFDVDLLYNFKKQKFKIKAIPTNWYDREYAKINFWNAGPWMVMGILRLRILNSPFKRFIKVYDKIIGFIPK